MTMTHEDNDNLRMQCLGRKVCFTGRCNVYRSCGVYT